MSEFNWEQFWRYNGIDSCVTLECCQVQGSQLDSKGRLHYNFNMEMQAPLLYMEMRGMRYDQTAAKQTAKEIHVEVNRLQYVLNKAVGRFTTITCEQDAVTLMREVFCVKRGASSVQRPEDCLNYARKAMLDDGTIHRAICLCTQGYPFSDERNGEFSRLVGTALNTDSPKQLAEFLYTTLGLEPQLHKKTRKVTTDAIALLKLFKKTGNPVLKVILKLSSLLTQLQTLEILCDPDGRIRCSYNIVGSDTGRLSCSKSPTRSGYNLQTVTKKQRRLFKPDDGCFLFQCDLSGADGWTVAAHSKRLGDPTMWDDYKFGLKPALLIALMREGGGLSMQSRAELLVQQAEIKKRLNDPNYTGIPYLGYKRIQHGGCYQMGKLTMSDQILEDSYKEFGVPVFVPPATCDEIKMLLFQRYPGVSVWHRWVGEQLKQHRQMTSATGHTRRFFGRPDDHDTLKQALADEPQQVTTYVTNWAMLNLWNDKTNRREDGSLVIEPLHQMHDSLNGQFAIDTTTVSVPKIRSYFNNEITIAGEKVVIPFEGAYGQSWSPDDLTNPI